MTVANGVNYTLYEAGTILDPGVWHGRVQVVYDTYEASAASAGSEFTVGVIPAGARILPISSVMTDAAGTAATIAVGDGTTADKFMAAANVSAAGNHNFDAIDELGEDLDAATTIVLTTAAQAFTGTIKVWVYYVM
jgi:hypothetical protein